MPARATAVVEDTISGTNTFLALKKRQRAQGVVAIRGDVAYDEDGPRADLNFEMGEGALAMTEGLGTMKSIATQGHVIYEEGFNGSGQLAIGNVDVGGAVVRDIESPMRFEKDTLHLDDAQGLLFGGSVQADATITLADLAGTLKGTLEHVEDIRALVVALDQPAELGQAGGVEKVGARLEAAPATNAGILVG